MLGCLLRFVGFFILLLLIAIAVRRITEHPTGQRVARSDERDTMVGKVRWRSREVGGEHQPPVIFVHGFLSSSTTWKRALLRASAGHDGIAIDLPGAGFSSRPWPYDYSAGGQAAALLDFLDARSIPRTVLVGNSLGGAVCLLVAAARPERVSGLVLVDSAFPGVTIPLGFRSLRTPFVGELQMEFLVKPVVEYTLRQRLYARADLVTSETVADWWDPIPVPGTRRAALAYVRTSSRGYENLLSRISAPTLVIWGKEDRLLPISNGVRLASQIRNARLVVLPDTGHLPEEETPELFGQTVAEFLAEVTGSSSSVR